MRTNWPVLYVKTASGAINYWQVWTDRHYVGTRWGKLGTDKELMDSYEAEGKNIGRSNETSPEQQAVLEAQSKYDKQLRLKYVTSVEEAESGVNIKPMRAYALDDKRQKKLKWPLTVQPKYNGVRCMAYNLPDGSVRLMSRGGKDYTLPHVQEELRGKIPHGWCLDGELYVHRTSLQTIRHYIETPTDKTLWVKMFCYDTTVLPPAGMPWRERAECLFEWFGRHALQSVVMSSSAEAADMAMVEKLHEFWTNDGFEGVMLREHHGPYKLAAKSVHLLKYKKFQDAEFKVVAWGTGRDGVVVYTCVQEDGATFDVRPEGNDAERAALLETAPQDVGKLLTVRFQERSDDHIPIFPVGVGFRPPEDMD